MMDCSECGYSTDQDFSYCPECGSEMSERTLDDFDFPLVIESGLRKDIHELMEYKTGLDLSNYEFNTHVFDVEIMVRRDGKAEIVDGFSEPESTGEVHGISDVEDSPFFIISYECPVCGEVTRQEHYKDVDCEECGSSLELSVVTAGDGDE